MDQGLIKYEDESPVDAKGMGRMIVDQVYELSLLGSNLRTMVRRALPQNKLEFTVVLADASPSRGVGADSPRVDGSPGESDRKRSSRQPYSQTYKVAVNFAAKIPVHAIANALRGQDSEHFQGAVRVLDITLIQNVAQKGSLLARQSFFHNEPRNFMNLGWWCSWLQGVSFELQGHTGWSFFEHG